MIMYSSQNKSVLNMSNGTNICFQSSFGCFKNLTDILKRLSSSIKTGSKTGDLEILLLPAFLLFYLFICPKYPQRHTALVTSVYALLAAM